MGIVAEPWQQPVAGGYLDPAILNLTGIEQIRAWVERQLALPPIAHLMGIDMTDAGEGTATFTMPASAWFLSPQGTIPIGVLAILADPPLGCAIQATLPPATPYTTAELSLTALRPARPSAGLLTGTGTIIHPGRRMALSEVRIGGADGRLVAHGTSRCMTLPALRDLPPLGPAGGAAQAAARDGDPWRLPVRGSAVPQEVWDEASGLEVLRRLAAGALTRPPISYLTGLTLTAVERGKATFVLPASLWLGSPVGRVEGGAVAMLADAALQTAIQTTAPAGAAVAALDLKVNFLRPCFPDGLALVSHGKVAHEGRSVVVGNATVVNAEGKPVALATGSAMIQRGRPAASGGEPNGN